MQKLPLALFARGANHLSQTETRFDSALSAGDRFAPRFWRIDLRRRIARELRDGNRTRGFSRPKSVLALVLAHGKISSEDAFYLKASREMFDSAPGTIISMT
jgi:hypothetical protein